MKTIKSYFLILSLIGFTMLTSCGSDDGGGDDTPQRTPEEQRLFDLAGTTGITWATTSVTFDGASSNFFSDLTLTLRGSVNAKRYTSSNGSPLWLASGTWDFNGDNLDQIFFDGDDGNIYNISINAGSSTSTLTMTVNYTSNGGVAAGTNGANGTYVFTMEEQ